jgi:hypothetical protein
MLMTKFIFGYGVTISAGLLSYPFSVLYARMIATSLSPKELKYTSSVQVARQIFKNEGVRAFWRGGGISVIGSIFGAGFLVFYDVFKATLK